VLAGAGHFTAGKEDICDPALAQRSPSRRCLGKRGVIAVQEMVTKDYPPWHGDSLSNLAIVREPHSIGVQSIEDSPEVRLILSRYASPQVSSTPAIWCVTRILSEQSHFGESLSRKEPTTKREISLNLVRRYRSS